MPASLLGRVGIACVRTLPIDGAAVSAMTRAGHRGVGFASDETARRLEDVQFTAGDGPGIDAFGSGHAVFAADLADPVMVASGRWPIVAGVAHELGVRALFAFPLHLGAAALGVLTLYRHRPGALDGADLTRALRLASAAAAGLLDLIGATSAGAADGVHVDASVAEFYRSEVYQAAGMLTAQLDVSIEVAMVRLRAYALAAGRPIGDVARDIVARTLRLEADNGTPSPQGKE